MTGAAVVGAAAQSPADRAKLSALRAEFASRASGGRYVCARSKEWAVLPLEFRFAVLLMAGIDGDMDALTRRAWREMPLPEREAIRGVMRGFAQALKASPSLCARWGDD